MYWYGSAGETRYFYQKTDIMIGVGICVNILAVYLCKRTMQNKTHLELEDFEAENLAKLQKLSLYYCFQSNGIQIGIYIIHSRFYSILL